MLDSWLELVLPLEVAAHLDMAFVAVLGSPQEASFFREFLILESVHLARRLTSIG